MAPSDTLDTLFQNTLISSPASPCFSARTTCEKLDPRTAVIQGPLSPPPYPNLLITVSVHSAWEAGEKLDPRAAVAGRAMAAATPSGELWQSGLFDRGSWVEAQAGWARSVVTGRARLGGVPVGVIAVETQTVMLNIPADPGAPDSSERIIPQVRMA